MRSKARSDHSVWANGCAGGGLPLCLFGIGIYPTLSPSGRAYRQRDVNIRRNADGTRLYMPGHAEAHVRVPFLVSAPASNRTRYFAHESSLVRYAVQEEPRYALALQMAELDRRREVIRKHRSSRVPEDINEDRTFLMLNAERDIIVDAVKRDPSFCLELEKSLHFYRCAKAA